MDAVGEKAMHAFADDAIHCLPGHVMIPVENNGEIVMRRPHVLAAIMLSCALAGPQTAAQIYPAKPVRVIVPTPAGGNPDFVVRPVAQKIS